MVCVHCGADTQVINSRHQKRLNQVWRRRKCKQCGAIFSTEESASYDGVWAVKSSSGTLQPFSRDKLLLSLYMSCKHRKNALRDAGALTDTVIKKLLGSHSGAIDKKLIVSTCQVALNRFDKSASTHYAAFHR